MVVAVSYIQAVRKQIKAENTFQIGVASVQKEKILLGGEPDSLMSMLHSQESTISKSPYSMRKSYLDKRLRQLLAYYKKRYQSLPSSLSASERQIAIAEIRKETAARYSITTFELDQLREYYRIPY
jgi:hypothetical protein